MSRLHDSFGRIVSAAYGGSAPRYRHSSILDRVGNVATLAVVVGMALSVAPLISPIFVFEVADEFHLSSTCESGRIRPSSMTEEEGVVLTRCDPDSGLGGAGIAVGLDHIYMSLVDVNAEPGDRIQLQLGSTSILLTKGNHDRTWATQYETDEPQLGSVSRRQGDVEIVPLASRTPPSEWTVLYSDSRVPPSGAEDPHRLSTLADSAEIPRLWFITAGLIFVVWGFRAGTPPRLVRIVRWLLLLGLAFYGQRLLEGEMAEVLGRLAVSADYPIAVPVGLATILVGGVPLGAHYLSKAVARRLETLDVLSMTPVRPHAADAFLIKLATACLLPAIVYVIASMANLAVARLFPGFTL